MPEELGGQQRDRQPGVRDGGPWHGRRRRSVGFRDNGDRAALGGLRREARAVDVQSLERDKDIARFDDTGIIGNAGHECG